MSQEKLLQRSDTCELCGSCESLRGYEVKGMDEDIVICKMCHGSIENPKEEINHWHCLSESMWSESGEVKVVAYRLLFKLKEEIWARDLLEMFYLEDELLKVAKEELKETDVLSQTKDSNGAVLQSGDSVSIVKDLDVKGAGFTAKRGTIVKNISLTDNVEQIEGRVNGVKIVLLSKFLKKA